MDETTHKFNFKPINIRDLFMNKNLSLACWIPGFVYRFLSRKLRVDFMNDPILYYHGYKKDVDFTRAIDNVKRINEIFESDEQVMSFPSGLVSRRRKELIRDTDWQKSIITKARQSKRDIVPLHVSGRCSKFFYNLAKLRRFLGIKTNIEMFFLPNESYKHRNKHFSPLDWAQKVKDHVYTLPDNPENEFSYTQN